MLVLGVDPGREKCGLAVVDKSRGVLWHEIVAAPELAAAVQTLVGRYSPDQVVMGNGTAHKRARESLQRQCPAVAVTFVDEYRTTDAARQRYWRDNPPSGWRRLWPLSMQVPSEPVDDYAAIIIAERYLTTLAGSK